MIPKPLRSFVYGLRSATDNGVLKWKEGAPESFFCNHKNHTLHISPHFNEDSSEASYLFRLVTDGKVTAFSVNHYEEDYNDMRDLYSSVMANANDVESDLKDFFDPE